MIQKCPICNSKRFLKEGKAHLCHKCGYTNAEVPLDKVEFRTYKRV